MVRAAALADARRTHASYGSSGRFGNAPETPRRANFSNVSVNECVTPCCARNANANANAARDVWLPKLSFGEVSAADLRAAAESSGRAPCFSGRVVDARAAASRGRRESDGGATKRVTVWVAQDSSGASTEVTLRPMAADDAEALARRLPDARCDSQTFSSSSAVPARARARRARTRSSSRTTLSPKRAYGPYGRDGSLRLPVLFQSMACVARERRARRGLGGEVRDAAPLPPSAVAPGASPTSLHHIH